MPVQLGCGTYEVFLTGNTPTIYPPLKLTPTSMSYNRVLDGRSEATVRIEGASGLATCCEAISQALPWRNGVLIKRNPDGDVWFGYLIRKTVGGGHAELYFEDVSAIWGRRYVRDHNFSLDSYFSSGGNVVPPAVDPATTILSALATDVQVPGNPYGSFIVAPSATPLLKRRYSANEGQSCADAIADLADSGKIDYTTLLETTWAGAPNMGPASTPVVLSDQSYVEMPEVTWDGTEQANVITVIGQTVGESDGNLGFGDLPAIMASGVDSTSVTLFGQLRSFVRDDSVADATDAVRVVDTQLAAHAYAAVVISGGTLSPEAACTMNHLSPESALVPGNEFSFLSNRYCGTVNVEGRIKEVRVDVDKDRESISLVIQPKGET